jgi:predicted transcriptional regulator
VSPSCPEIVCPTIVHARISDQTPLQGDLQIQVMGVLWRLGEGTVEQVRSALPRRYQGAYTTVQTVLNRLAERGLLSREKAGRGFVYRPDVSEADYVSRTIERALSGASADARQAALAQLVGGLDKDELSELQRRSRDIGKARRRKGR